MIICHHCATRDLSPDLWNPESGVWSLDIIHSIGMEITPFQLHSYFLLELHLKLHEMPLREPVYQRTCLTFIPFTPTKLISPVACPSWPY